MQRLLLIVLLLLLLSSSVAAKDWRGIRPMHSTRADVVALLGLAPPGENQSNRSVTSSLRYSLDEGQVYIWFADEHFLKERNCKAVRIDTVLMIQITPKDLLLSSLNLDDKKFRKFDPSTPPEIGFEAFIDNDEGLLLRSYQGKVQEIFYLPSAMDRVRCPEYFENPEAMVQIMRCGYISKFDEYGAISFADEKARLENFGLQLMKSEKTVGYIIVHAGRKATIAEAKIRANRARGYLISVLKIDPAWVKAIDAGYQEEATVSLYLWPADSEPPQFEGSIDPSEVEIIYPKKRTLRKRP